MSKSAHIFDKTSCPSIETLRNYYLKELDKNEMREVELHLIDCEMCNDVLDGLAEMKHPDKTGLYTNEIEQKLNQAKTTKRNTGMPLKIAAAIAFLILAGGSIFLFNFLKEGTSESMLGDNIQKEAKTGKGTSGLEEKTEKSLIIEEKETAAYTLADKYSKGRKSSEEEVLAKEELIEEVTDVDKQAVIKEEDLTAEKENLTGEEVFAVTQEEEIAEPEIMETNESEYVLNEIEQKEEPLANKEYPSAMKSAKTRASYHPKGSGGKDSFIEATSDSLLNESYKLSGETKMSLTELKNKLKYDPEDGALLLGLAEAYYNAGEYKNSVKIISKIVDLELTEYYSACKILLEKIANESNKHWKKVEKLLRKME